MDSVKISLRFLIILETTKEAFFEILLDKTFEV